MSLRNLIPAITIILVICLPLYAMSKPGLRVTEPVYEFGSVGGDYMIHHNFYLINESDKLITIDSAKATCDCSYTTFYDSIVQPNDSALLKLNFSTKDYYGPIERFLRVAYDTPGAEPFEIAYRSIVDQWLYGIVPKPISLFFLPGSKSKTVMFSNPILESLKISSIEPFDDLLSFEQIVTHANKGEQLKLLVKVSSDKKSGTYLSNFKVTFEVPDGKSPVSITIPAKIVVY